MKRPRKATSAGGEGSPVWTAYSAERPELALQKPQGGVSWSPPGWWMPSSGVIKAIPSISELTLDAKLQVWRLSPVSL